MFKNLFKKKPQPPKEIVTFEEKTHFEKAMETADRQFAALPELRISRIDVVDVNGKIVSTEFQVQRKWKLVIGQSCYTLESSFDNIEDARKEKERLEYASSLKTVETVFTED